MNELQEILNKEMKKKIQEQRKNKLTFQSSEPPILFVLCLVGHGMRVFL